MSTSSWCETQRSEILQIFVSLKDIFVTGLMTKFVSSNVERSLVTRESKFESDPFKQTLILHLLQTTKTSLLRVMEIRVLTTFIQDYMSAHSYPYKFLTPRD